MHRLAGCRIFSRLARLTAFPSHTAPPAANAGELSHTHLPRRSAALRTLAALCAMGGDRTQLWSVLLPLLEGEVRVGEKAGQAKGGSGVSCCVASS